MCNTRQETPFFLLLDGRNGHNSLVMLVTIEIWRGADHCSRNCFVLCFLLWSRVRTAQGGLGVATSQVLARFAAVHVPLAALYCCDWLVLEWDDVWRILTAGRWPTSFLSNLLVLLRFHRARPFSVHLQILSYEKFSPLLSWDPFSS